MRFLVYAGLDPGRLQPAFDKVRSAVERDDLKSADVKKLQAAPHYRAKLHGASRLLPDTEPARRGIDARTRGSTRCAVLVLRDADKAAARAAFHTPLVFSVHEAKGLEYPTIVLYGMVSAHCGYGATAAALAELLPAAESEREPA
ncbi:MAG TPA: hypothetical protein VF292_01285 [Rhodanobacteraceae bacterium]